MLFRLIKLSALAACCCLVQPACQPPERPVEQRSPVVVIYQKTPFTSSNILGTRSDLFRRIKTAVDEVQLIDTHEHLVTEKEWLSHEVNFFYWFQHYASSDLVSSGMSREALSYIRDPKNNPDSCWARMAPYWPRIRYTGYGQVLRIAARDLYGIPDIDKTTWQELSIRIAAAKKPGFYDRVLKQKAGIQLAILDNIRPDSGLAGGVRPPFFVRVKRFDNFVQLTKDNLQGIETEYNVKLRRLDDVLKTLDKGFEQIIAENYVGIKSGLAYSRILRFEDTPRNEAERVFNQQRRLKRELTDQERKPLEDFMMHEIARRAGEHNLPFQIHTGLQEGNGNIITNSNPTLLVNLFMKYPQTRFDIFHGSFPYMGELTTLAKNFQNVYIDMCWMPIISPGAAREWLHKWLETVPVNKISAFGGDYLFPDGTYAHSVIARQIVAEVLTEKVGQGYLTEDEAGRIARMILRENVVALFSLERFL